MSVDSNAAAALLGGPVSTTTAEFPVGAQGGATEVAFPFQVTPHGRVAGATWEAHVEQMIEQVLFTAPGERVNRPDFGSGLLQLVFAPLSDELTATTQFLVQGALQQWLGDIIQVDDVTVDAGDGRVEVTVRYLIRRTDQRREETFSREA